MCLCSVWRPLIEPLVDWPLAVTDNRTFSMDDCLELRLRIKTHNEEYDGDSATFMYNKSHKWQVTH